MAYPSSQIGQDPQSKTLGYITKQLDRLMGLVGKSSTGSNKVQVVDSGGTNVDFATSAIQTEQLTALESIAGQTFLVISDTNAHANLDCTSIYIMEDTVFNEILVGGSDIVASSGLTGLTISAGVLLPFGKAHATSIDLTSGKVIAYIN